QGDIIRLMGVWTRHDGRECGIYDALNGRHRTEACSEREAFDTVCGELAFYSFVGANVGTSEAVDRLFWISDNKQFSRFRSCLVPQGHARVCSGQKQENLRLNNACVLELIHKDV